MKTIKVLGSGCSKCIKTAEIIGKVAAELGAEVDVIKETDPEAIMNYGVMSTPAVVIDDEVVHSGSIPSQDAIRGWLSN
ncbi:thioredoxin family protein [Marinobacterium lutimaris]|uniref:Small redox-active disulfide protein 2 n=1 Tax=Marinobacterium lutimaris TaxID=568106 RepID=A0A1H6DQT1_9GAMM|nr:thioredoxin family protein [Marinobacterium lutimaris]SEG87601.1 small redox-active disulfide protein 2 [Marinobacterium lutimaris]